MGEPLYSLYIHKFPNGKVYIWITKRTLKQRFKYQGKGYVNQTFMYRAIQKYGWDNIGHYHLADRLPKQVAIELEKQLIRECAKVLGLSPASICKRIKEHSYFNECFLSY